MNTTALQTACGLLGGDSFPKCESVSLRLEKFVRLGDNVKKDEIREVVSKGKGGIPRFAPKGAVSFVATLGGRLIVNQAGGVLENAGLCLHPHFNAPYIPGSAVKGGARHAAWQVWDEAEEGEAKIAAAKDVAEIFGFPTGDAGLDGYLEKNCGYAAAQAGKVAFLAAVPETTAQLVVDVVTCHHPKYYQGDKAFRDAPDTESPIPNFFPAVKEGAAFVFSLLPCRGGEHLVGKARAFLVKAISENGVGAKTAAGYGWFVYSDEENEKWKARERERRDRMALESAKCALVQKIRRIEAIEDIDLLKRELMEIEKSVAQLPKGWDDLQQNERDIFNRRKKDLPQVSPFDAAKAEWAGKEARECVTHRFILEFSDDKLVPPDVKAQLVAMLREPDGVGAKIWGFLRNDQNYTCLKKKVADRLRRSVPCIREFARKQPEGKLK